MSFEKNIERLPKTQRTNGFQSGATDYDKACSTFLGTSGDSNAVRALQPLLSSLSQRCAVGPIAMLPTEYLVYTKGVASITAPFHLDGAAKCLSELKTLYEVCGVEKFDGRKRMFPGLCIGHDRNGTKFYMFLSDFVLLGDGEGGRNGEIKGLGGQVLSLTTEDMRTTTRKIAESCQTFPEFVFELASSSCCGSAHDLLAFSFDIYDAGVVTSPCKEEQKPFVQQFIARVFLRPQQLDMEAVWKLDRFKFLVALLDE